jgi:REP element-mobilizing transposase RayT
MGTVDVERLRDIKTLPSLIRFLRDELDWPIEAEEIEDLTFDYAPEELGLDPQHAAKIKEIKQLRPLETHQPWGIFWVSFEKKRLPMVVLRRILGNLVMKRRAGSRKSDRPSWQLHDLLFISSYGEEESRTLSFAHFSEAPETGQLPVLRVLGWDDQNSIMHLDRVSNRLSSHLNWPDNADDVDAWRQRWSEAFTDRYREAIRSADVLIPRLAQLAANIRRRVRDVLDAESERGPMRRLFAAVRELLIHDMDEDAFADMYAQTVSYGLLSAAFSRQADIHPQNLVQLTAVSNPFLENLLENLFRLNRGKFHFEVDEVGINDVLDLLRNTNMEAIKAAFSDKNPAEDPVIRFYEGFLKEYDPKQRIRRGIFFTPRPVVSYIVRSVHELLQTEFGLEDGLASTITWGDFVETASSRLNGSCQGEAAPSRFQTKRQDAASTSVQYFDPDAPVAHLSGNLPHWRQQGTTYFVTFRLADSMPQQKLDQWLEECDAWLMANPEPHSPDQRRQYYERFPARFQAWLDQGYGSCVLCKPEIKAIVESTLRHFDGDRYHLDEFVVMPNHVHVLVTPLGGNLLSDILHSWKSFSASEINKRLARTGTLWQKETFDHIVRSPESLRRIREYIRDNPKYVETASSRLGGDAAEAASSRLTASARDVETASSRLPTRQDAASTIRTPEGAKPEDPFVCILDPAVGTGTFLFECIEVIERTMKTKWGRELRMPNPDDRSTWRDPQILRRWQDYVPKHLLPRLYGYELMMAPYAIAHLKLALKLGETGYQFREGDRLHIYLTNSLEPPSDVADSKLADLFAPLAREAQEVNDIKRHKRFTVVIGNPPYAAASSNTGEWIMSLIDLYKKNVREAETQIRTLSDDYVKFFRLAQLVVGASAVGVIGLITNSGFTDGVIFRDFRQAMLGTFDYLRILDLHGHGRRDRHHPHDENVFDILVGTVISLFVRLRGPQRRVFRAEVIGPRQMKYDYLSAGSARNTSWKEIALEPSKALFHAIDHVLQAEYENAVPFLSVWGSGNESSDRHQVYGFGFKTQQDEFAIAFERNTVEERLNLLLHPDTTERSLRERFKLCNTNQWSFAIARRRLAKMHWKKKIIRVLYRPFDWRFTCYLPDVVTNPRPRVMSHMMQANRALLASRQVTGNEWRHIFVSDSVVECCAVSLASKEGCHVFPLYGSAKDGGGARLLKAENRSHINPSIARSLSELIGLNWIERGKGTLKPRGTLGPEDILHYVYGLCHSVTYRHRYSQFLRYDFPRVFLTSSLELFGALANLGGELVALHLMESPKLDKPITEWRGAAPSGEVEKVSYVEAASSRLPTRQDAASTAGSALITRQDAASTAASTNGTVFIDKAQTQGFHGVPENVWNFHIGGYQVCHKWLKDRKGRTLSADDITHYHKIVVALNETICLMAEIDKVIEAHGGWPGAFAGTESPGK